jgi:hypothetical protein
LQRADAGDEKWARKRSDEFSTSELLQQGSPISQTYPQKWILYPVIFLHFLSLDGTQKGVGRLIKGVEGRK